MADLLVLTLLFLMISPGYFLICLLLSYLVGEEKPARKSPNSAYNHSRYHYSPTILGEPKKGERPIYTVRETKLLSLSREDRDWLDELINGKSSRTQGETKKS